MDHIPLPPNGPSYSPSQITNNSSPESSNVLINSSAPMIDKVPVLGKEKAKKRLLAFGKGISFGLKPRNKSIQSSRENPVTCNDDEDDEKESSSFASSSLSAPSKKLNIDAIMEEEKEIAASRPSLSYIPPRLAASASTNVMSAVPQLIVPVLPPHAIVPPIPAVTSSSMDKPGSPSSRHEDRHSNKRSFHRREDRRHHLSSDKYNDIVDIPSNWKSFKALGLQVYEPEFPKFKRQLDKEYDRLGNIESRKRTNLNIVKSGDEFIWKEYVKDPVASDCELAFRGLNPRIVQSYTKENMQDLLWDLDSDYHSKEFPKSANHKIKGRHSVTYCYHPRFYQMKYEQRKDIFHTDEEKCKFELLLEVLFKTKKDEEIDNSKFTSGSFVSKEVPSPIEHRQWYTKIENFMNDKETVFPEVLRARQKEGFVPSRALTRMELSHAYNLKRDDSGEDSLEYSKKVEHEKSAIISEKRNKSKKKSSKRHLAEEVEDSDIPSKKASKRQKRECDETNGESAKKTTEVFSDSEHGEEKEKKKKKKTKKKLKKSSMDLEFDDEDDDNVDSKSLKKKKKHSKKRKKRKKSKKKYERKDQASPLMDEAILSTDKSIGLCNIGTWEDPMKLTEITITSQCDDDVRSPSPPPASSSSRGGINTKDPRTRSLFAVAGYGYEDDASSKRKNSCGPRTPSPKSSNSRGPRTPSPKSKSNWRPPSPRISPPRPDDGSPVHSSRKSSRRRSRSRSYDRCSSSGGHSRHSRSPSHHRRGIPHRRISRSPPRRPSHRYYRSPSPASHYNGPNNPSYHMERDSRLSDPTLSDADLPGYSSNLRQIYAYENFSASSPKRLSLDERLEKELGINVREVHPPQDFSIPPPGYPVRPPPLVPSHPPPPILPHMLHQEPIHHHPPSTTLIPTSLPPPCLPHKDVPEEGRLVRVGNMLQIVPEPTQPPQQHTASGPLMVPPPNDHVVAATAAAVAAAAAVTAALQEPKEAPVPQPAANTAVTLMRKMEEMKRQRDRERESKREQKSERTNAVVVEPVPTPKVEEEQQQQQQQLPPSPLEENNQEDADEAKILQEAISSVPEMDDEYFTSSPNPIADSTPKSYSKNKKHDRIHYISLKPFFKKERKRQKTMSNATPNSQLPTPNNSLASVDDTMDDDEEWVPRSPVPLPDASTCKPILMQLGFSGREKKVLRYADGILPGQGSPDISDVETGTNLSTDQQQSTSIKKRKKIRLKIISQKDQSLSDSPPPPPPSGSPPLHHYSTWLTRHMPLTTR